MELPLYLYSITKLLVSSNYLIITITLTWHQLRKRSEQSVIKISWAIQANKLDYMWKMPMTLHAELSPKLDHTNTVLLVGNTIASGQSNKATDNSWNYTVGTSSHRTVLRMWHAMFIWCYPTFRKHVAHAAARDLQRLMDSKTIVDNGDET